MLAFELVKSLVPAMSRIHVENDEPGNGAGADADVGVGRNCPPPADHFNFSRRV